MRTGPSTTRPGYYITNAPSNLSIVFARDLPSDILATRYPHCHSLGASWCANTSKPTQHNHWLVSRVIALPTRSTLTAKIPFHSKKKSLLGSQQSTSYQPLEGGYHARNGYTSETTQSTPPKMFWPSSKWVWAFALISLVQAAAVLALEM